MFLLPLQSMKNIVFDLGGVVFARDPQKCTTDFINFFSFIRSEQMPLFWEEYDRGTATIDQTVEALVRITGRDAELCRDYIGQAISRQEAIPATERLISELKAAGYRLYVLSNMSREFIDFLRTIPVYSNFDGEVVSCEELTVKPEPHIYEILLDRFGLEPSETLFIDDRAANLTAAAAFGISTYLFLHHDAEGSCRKLRKQLL